MRIHEAIQRYIEQKRAGGVSFAKGAQTLRSLHSHLGDALLRNISERQVTSFLNGPCTSTVTWRSKHLLLRRFFLYWMARGEMELLPMPPLRAPVPQVFTPYIYSRLELRQLFRATRISQSHESCQFDARTFRTLLLFLYGTGSRVGEARRIQCRDVDFRRRRVSISGGQFGRSRDIPLGPDLYRILWAYAKGKTRRRGKGDEEPFFSDRDGNGLNETTLAKGFQRLRRVARLTRRDGCPYEPRLHDLRHTFAVHRLTSWFKHGADLNRMVPALSAYIGQVGLGSTERYLAMTPERFRTQLENSVRNGPRNIGGMIQPSCGLWIVSKMTGCNDEAC